MRRIVLRSVLLVGMIPLIGNGSADGLYARAAQPIWERIAGGINRPPLRLKSPDRATTVSVRYVERKGEPAVILQVAGRMGSGHVDIGPGVASELLWAPDSRAFAVTTSDQGANGLFRTVVFARGAKGLQVRDLSRLIVRAFGHPVKCGWPEEPNVAALKWLAGSARLIVVGEIVAHSNCDSFGTFRAYEVDRRSMRIVKSYDQLTAKKWFGAAMGIELRDAPDRCVRRPRSCWVSINHPGLVR
ncbi:hypothetical protein [Sphingomonas sp.]|uniref:hypothetical protein n=1 Tax=Sphingomonas sp. TaxID=28214 RepID=UPI0025FC9D9E|nr:hypothetical protein [Sphingomonas sp.]